MIDQRSKTAQRRFHRRGLFHIDACPAENVEGELRAAGFQEPHVVVEFLLTAVQNALVSNLELPVGLLAAAMLGEHVQNTALVGGLLVVIGAMLAVAQWPRRRALSMP